MATPIWKDYYVQVGTSAANAFKIKDKNMSVIYEGIAFKKPGQTSATIRVNDICADYLSRTVPVFAPDRFTPENIRQKFTITNGSNTTIDDVSLYLDWSYEDLGDTTGILPMSAPIIRRVASNQYIPATSTSNSADYLQIYVGGDISDIEDVAVGGLGTLMIRPTDYDGYESKVGVQNHFYDPKIGEFAIVYDVIGTCNQYAMYYVNAYGAWDTLLLEGKVIRTDRYARNTFKPDYDNTDPSATGKVNYRTDIVRTWEVWTGWLTDEEASRMHHLLGTCMAVMCYLPGLDVYPVIITNADCPFKRNKDGKVAYGITLEETRDYQRR